MLTHEGGPEPADEIGQEPRWDFRLPGRRRLTARWRLAALAVVLLIAVPVSAYRMHAREARPALPASPVSGTPQATVHQNASACSPSTGACSFRFPLPRGGRDLAVRLGES